MLTCPAPFILCGAGRCGWDKEEFVDTYQLVPGTSKHRAGLLESTNSELLFFAWRGPCTAEAPIISKLSITEGSSPSETPWCSWGDQKQQLGFKVLPPGLWTQFPSIEKCFSFLFTESYPYSKNWRMHFEHKLLSLQRSTPPPLIFNKCQSSDITVTSGVR